MDRSFVYSLIPGRGEEARYSGFISFAGVILTWLPVLLYAILENAGAGKASILPVPAMMVVAVCYYAGIDHVRGVSRFTKTPEIMSNVTAQCATDIEVQISDH